MNLNREKTYLGFITLVCLVLLFSSSAFAVPTLQVGAPGGAGEGTYADYIDSTDPVEEDTAFTSGSQIYAAGAYQHDELLIGGQYESGNNWSSFGFDSSFDTAGAVLMATVPDGTLGSGTLMIGGNNYIYSTEVFEDGFSTPNNHAPIQNNDYMFFDIGDFAKTGSVANFDNETGSTDGEIKDLLIATGGYEWIHFDLFAIVTDENGSKIKTSFEINPGSKDLTWKNPQWNSPPQPVPEPDTFLLLGSGLIGFLFYRKKIAG